MSARLYVCIKDGKMNVYTPGRFVNTNAEKGLVQKANDGNYYEETIIMVDGMQQKILGDSLGTSA